MASKSISVCVFSMESWWQIALCPSSLLAPCLQGTSRHDFASGDQSFVGLPPSGEQQEEEEEEEEKEEYEQQELEKSESSGVGVGVGEETVSTSAGSSVVDTTAAVPSDACSAEGASPCSVSRDLSTHGQPPQRVESMAEQPVAEKAEEEVSSEKPNFSGTWDLVRTEGDLDRLLSDMGQGWLIRSGAKALKYGIGRVVVDCQQDGDDLKFSKVLCDPRNLSKSNVHITVGEGSVRFLDDIGRLSSTSQWDGSSLRFDAKLESSGLAVTLLMYFSSEGNFVEEMISCKGTVAKYVFDRRA